jgi:hypothetical protein
MLVNTKINRENYFEGNVGSSNVEADKKSWCSLWKTVVPSKIKVFLWRLAQHSLLTTDILDHRNMATHSNCSLCGCVNSWRHSLLECNMARSVWALSNEEMVERITMNENPDARQWLFYMIDSMPHDQFVKTAVTLWAIWTTRRKAIHEEIFQSPVSTFGFINQFLSELQSLEKPRTLQVDSRKVSMVRIWKPPPPGLAKINVDASVSRE